MNWELILQVTVPMFMIIGWMWNRMDKQFEKVDKQFDSIHNDFNDIKKDITDLKVSVAKLETRLEERTLRVMHIDKTGTKNN